MTLNGHLSSGHRLIDDEGWLPIADLMAGLMVFFVLVAMWMGQRQVALNSQAAVQQINEQKQQSVAVRQKIVLAMQRGLASVLQKPSVVFDPDTLSVEFAQSESESEGVLFDASQQQKLRRFIPRVLDVLRPYRRELARIIVVSRVVRESDSLDGVVLANETAASVLATIGDVSVSPADARWLASLIAVQARTEPLKTTRSLKLESQLPGFRLSLRFELNPESVGPRL